MSNYNNSLIFGKNRTENIVAVETVKDKLVLFRELNGDVIVEEVPNKFWLINKTCPDIFEFNKLEGNLSFKYIKYFKNNEDFQKQKYNYKKSAYFINDSKEAALIYTGCTYFKGMKVSDVSLLSFDIETTGLVHDHTSEVLIISNTFRKNGKITRKLFTYDDYENTGEMLKDWCKWVVEINPSVLIGHNIFTFDIPYMVYIANRHGVELELGRDLSPITFDNWNSKFRKDGSQTLEYKKAHIFGRNIIDTFFLAIKFDIGRKYESYALKKIVAQEGFEDKNRQHYDGGQIRFNYKNKEEWKKIKKYAEQDSDDSIKLYDLMIPSFFYLSQYIPKSFQNICLSASGSQINSFMVRAYLSEGHSIPEASEVGKYEGGVSFGIPGVYKNAFKIDISSAYPHCILQYEIYDRVKDPKGYILKMVQYFLKERLEDKRLAKETGERHYDDMSNAKKILINSAYGFMGAGGLNFNYPMGAAEITRRCREIIDTALKWASGKDSDYWKTKAADPDKQENDEENEFLNVSGESYD